MSLLTEERIHSIQEKLESGELDRNQKKELINLLTEARRRELLQYYRKKPVEFIENELIIYNPEYDPPDIPFKLYPYQKEFIDRVYDAYIRKDILLNEKSRQMGFSWMYMAFFVWGILFRPEFSAFVMSYKEDLVDDGGTPLPLQVRIRSRCSKARFR